MVIDNLNISDTHRTEFLPETPSGAFKKFAKTNPNLSYRVQKPKGMTGLDWTMEQKEISLIKF